MNRPVGVLREAGKTDDHRFQSAIGNAERHLFDVALIHLDVRSGFFGVDEQRFFDNPHVDALLRVEQIQLGFNL